MEYTYTAHDAFHGSDLEKIEAKYHIKASDIISFSANVNPLGLSDKLKKELSDHLDSLSSYPDREYTALKKVIAAYCDTTSEHVTVGNGSSELISLFIRSLNPSRTIIIGPTYSEYASEAASCGGSCKYFELRESDDFRLDKEALFDELRRGCDLLILCNPNNPTSTAIKRDVLSELTALCRTLGAFVLIDETYVEFAGDYDDINAIPLTEKYDNLAVLRGTSKFFAAPGLRLGYALCKNAALRDKVFGVQIPWSINSLAEVAGRLMFTDESFKQRTKELIFSERERLISILSKNPALKVYPADANFILVRSLRDGFTAGGLFEAAIKEHMMIRDCSSFEFLDESYFRFCIMKREDNDRLMECISSYFLPR